MTLPSRPGNWRTRSSNTSPTVAPSARTVAWPLARGRRMVGKRTSTDTATPEPQKLTSELKILLTLENHLLFGDVPVHDAVAAQDGRLVLEAEDYVVPGGVGGLGHVGGRRVGVGVGVGVEHPD